MKVEKQKIRDRIMAMFLLSAIGDALGMPAEILTAAEIKERYGYIDKYYPARDEHEHCRGFIPGRWTDDTQLTLAVARSLTNKGYIDLFDMYSEHIKEKERSIAGWGKSTIQSLASIKIGSSEKEIAASGNPNGAGNGIVMKIAPIGAYIYVECLMNHYFVDEFEFLISTYEGIKNLTTMTHMTRMAVGSGRAQVEAINYLLGCGDNFNYYDFSSRVILSTISGENNCIKDDVEDVLSERLRYLFFSRDLMKMNTEELLAQTGNATYYVFNSLPFSHAMFLRGPRKIETLYDTVSAGGDTDTNGAIVGALLGAYNGTKIIPKHLLEGLWNREEVEKTAAEFCDSLGL